ncbi:hypothetical protein Poly30_11700 [Planctomycetes bacterium Poly30]|uniref:Uncharacterized protein n=1 Tax=Saltatorellus ferox TaxID=2528018 RepID=A0A518ENK3_9BACT|nr:hypothetical protein Poly30_11700 [Planctomycetes bacterium Poly30]
MKFLLNNALEIAGIALLAGFCVQWTFMGVETPAEGFAEMKRAALVVDASGPAPAPVWLSGSRVALAD